MEKMVLGIDAGSSSTKLLAMDTAGQKFITPMRVGPASGHKSFCAMVSRFVADHSMEVTDLAWIAATGSRATDIGQEILNIPVRRVNEIQAVAEGALRLSGCEKGVVVNMGTGVSFIYAEKGKAPKHLCGSGVGGGTLLGLGSRLLNTNNYTEILFHAGKGDCRKVDISISDLDLKDVATLDPGMTLSNFGKLKADDGVEAKDAAAGLVNLILQTAGTEAVLACRAAGCDTAILAGVLADLPRAGENFRQFEELYGIRFRHAGMSAYVTVAGALFCAMEED